MATAPPPPLRLWRIAGAAYPVWSGEGARLRGARWNPPGLPAIYAGTSYAIAALEQIVHGNIGRLPRALRFVEAVVPGDARIDRIDPNAVPGWDAPDMTASRACGAAWLRRAEAAVLLVPSVVTGGADLNAVVNPLHPDAARITVSDERPVATDPRLAQHPR